MQQKVYVVTGGARGIGRALVEYLISIGHFVFFIDIRIDLAKQMIESLDSEMLVFIPCDLSQKEDIEKAVIAIENYGKTIDCLVNNAAISSGGLLTSSYEGFMHTLSVNLVAPFYLSKLIEPMMNLKSSIINIGSTRAFQSQKDTESYSASKGGIISLTHAMMMTLDGKIRVNAISPGWIDTSSDQDNDVLDHKQHPSKRIGLPKDVIHAVMYLSSDDNDFLNGQNIIIDGGMSKQMIYHKDENWEYKK
jgi:NAD(P)-dependent dehydrogenase (short-subunit alcohol dehydrogenase family)